MKKRGQAVAMPFGMIFAIFLIVVFVVIAFIAVKSFLDIGDSARVGLFYDDLQEEINDAVRSQEVSSSFEIDLPSGITHVCFANLSSSITKPGANYEAIKDYEVYDWNVFLVPPEYAENMQGKVLDRVNISRITRDENPYCVSTDVDLRIKKDFYDRFVLIE